MTLQSTNTYPMSNFSTLHDRFSANGAQAMTPDDVRNHMKKVFPSQESAAVKKELVIVKSKSGRKTQEAVVEKNLDTNHLINYTIKLESGASVSIPEYATLVKIDNEVLILGFPISSRSRFKPGRDINLKITVDDSSFDAYCPGIHSDIEELEISMSIYLITK